MLLEGNASHNNYRNSTYWTRDCSYVRLKNLEIGYSLPKDFLSHLRIENARVFIQGTNLLTFSDFKLWDPEMGSADGEAYPLTRAFTAGLTVSF